MEPVLFGLVLAAGAAAATWLVARRSSADATSDAIQEAARGLHALERDSTVVLDLEPEDVDDERVQRLVRVAAAQVFQQEARVQAVTVKNRAGVVLGRVPRNAPPLKHVPDLVHPPGEGPRGRQPSPVGTDVPTLPPLDPDGLPSDPVHRDLVDTFDLPPSVQQHVTDPQEPLAIIRAILTAAGHATQRTDDVLVTGDVAFLVIDGHGRAVLSDQLSTAYLHFQATHVKRGYVVVMGYADRTELDRRQALAPELTYVGREAIQRMADAVGLGADPLAFITPPAVEIVRT